MHQYKDNAQKRTKCRYGKSEPEDDGGTESTYGLRPKEVKLFLNR